MSQSAMILRFLKQGKTLTSLDGVRLFRTTRLAARIKDLRDNGVRIKTEIVRSGNARFARYRLAA